MLSIIVMRLRSLVEVLIIIESVHIELLAYIKPEIMKFKN
jgi:hypothetical protein